MTDLLKILPSFPTGPFAALLPVVEQHSLSTTDLLTQHPVDLAKQTRIPLLDLKRFIAVVQASLADDLTPEKPLAGPKPTRRDTDKDTGGAEEARDGATTTTTTGCASSETRLNAPVRAGPAQTSCISTLDDTLDAALGGGVPVGYITEFAGESGAGKTQFLLSLCLAVQLPAPRGLGRQALYVSTEAALATRRLSQMLAGSDALRDLDDAAPCRPSLDNILSTVTPDLESQDHILEYQVPVLLARHDIGLLVIDSVAANYRAEFESRGSSLGSSMAARSAQLVRLGAHLRDLARRHGIAVVVANQVADRFASNAPLSSSSSSSLAHRTATGAPAPESPLASRGRQQQQQQQPQPQPPPSTLQATPTSSMPMPTPNDRMPLPPPTLLLDHQQRWFTGWGDEPRSSYALKTPSLGLVWSTQIACRVALFKRPVYGRPRRFAAPIDANDDDDGGEDREPTLKSWRRWMKVVFAPHVAASGQGIADAAEFEVTVGGLKGVSKDHGKTKG
ncbi:hypothetical protein ARSEF4850_005246 [Beauveria asiatica]